MDPASTRELISWGAPGVVIIMMAAVIAWQRSQIEKRDLRIEKLTDMMLLGSRQDTEKLLGALNIASAATTSETKELERLSRGIEGIGKDISDLKRAPP